MAAEHQVGNVNVETTDRGCFDFLRKNKEDQQEAEVVAAEFEQKVEVSKVENKEEEDKKKEGGILRKLHRSDSSSSSSSDEEEGDDEEKKRKKKEKKEKKGLKEKIKDKLPGHKDYKDHEEDTNVPIEHVHVEEVPPSHPPPPPPHHQEAETPEAEKKGLLEKIKDKLPGQHKKPEGDHDVAPAAPAPAAEGEGEKKGFLDKIKEKIPGFHLKPAEEEKKDVEKRECAEPTSST